VNNDPSNAASQRIQSRAGTIKRQKIVSRFSFFSFFFLFFFFFFFLTNDKLRSLRRASALNFYSTILLLDYSFIKDETARLGGSLRSLLLFLKTPRISLHFSIHEELRRRLVISPRNKGIDHPRLIWMGFYGVTKNRARRRYPSRPQQDTIIVLQALQPLANTRE